MLFHRNPEELREYIREALLRTGGEVAEAARYLDITRAYIWHWMRRLEMGKEPAAIREEAAKRFRLTG